MSSDLEAGEEEFRRAGVEQRQTDLNLGEPNARDNSARNDVSERSLLTEILAQPPPRPLRKYLLPARFLVQIVKLAVPEKLHCSHSIHLCGKALCQFRGDSKACHKSSSIASSHLSVISHNPVVPIYRPPTTLSFEMRLFLIPISTRRALIYARPLRRDAAKELSLLDRATSKAAGTWAQWEEAESGWKKHLVTWGNRVQQRIPFEEWGLKSIPSLKQQRRIDQSHGTKQINVLYPANAIRRENIPQMLRKIATERQEFHRKQMWWNLGLSPLTAPFAIIPVYVTVLGWVLQCILLLISVSRLIGSPTFLSSIWCTEAGRIGAVGPHLTPFRRRGAKC